MNSYEDFRKAKGKERVIIWESLTQEQKQSYATRLSPIIDLSKETIMKTFDDLVSYQYIQCGKNDGNSRNI